MKEEIITFSIPRIAIILIVIWLLLVIINNILSLYDRKLSKKIKELKDKLNS